MIRSLIKAAVFGLGLSLLAFPATAQQSTKLTYSNYLPPTHASNRYGLEPLFKAVEQETKGSLKINLQPGGVLVGGKGTLAAMRDGLIDGGFVVSLYVPNEIPVNTALSDLAFLIDDPLVGMGAVNETVLLDCPDCLKEYAKYKTVYFGAYSTTPYNAMCNKPIATLADVKGLKMRAAGSVYSRWVAAMGGVPVNMPNAEAYEAMQRGQLDCVVGSISWLKTLSLWDVAKNVIDAPMGTYFGGAFIALNTDSWKKVKPADRAVFVKLIPTALAKLAVGYANDDKDVESQAKSKGVQIKPAGAALENLINDFRKGELKNAAEAAKKRGVKNPEPVIEAFVKNVKKWKGIVAKTGHDEKKFEQALRQEIYDKADGR